MPIILTRIVIVLILMFGPLTISWAQTNKVNLSKKIEYDIKDVLLKHLDPEANVKQRERIQSRAKLIANTVLGIQTEAVDSDLATWIDDSLVWLANNRAGILVSDNPQSDALVKVLIDQSNKRFATLDNKKGQQLHTKSKMLLASADVFQSDLKNYFKVKLSQIDTTRLDLGMSAFEQRRDIQFNKIVTDLDIDVFPIKSRDQKDFQDDAIMSRLLTLSLIHQLDLDLSASKVKDLFSFGNLFSTVFDDNSELDISKIKNFDMALPTFEIAFNNCVQVHSKETTINFDDLRSLIATATNYRLNKTTPAIIKKGNAPSAYLIFRNDQSSWSLLN